MSPSFTVKRGVRYCCYVSSAVLKGRKSQAGSRTRVSSDVVEDAVKRVLHEHVPETIGQSPQDIQVAVSQTIDRVVLSNEHIRVQLKSEAGETPAEIRVPRLASNNKETRVQLRETACAEAQPNQRLLRALVRAHSWVKLLTEGRHQCVESLGTSVGLHPKIIRNSIRLAFLDPIITKALLRGEHAPTPCLKDFAGAVPLSWSDQRASISDFQTG